LCIKSNGIINENIIKMEDKILKALKELVAELDKQSDKLPRDNDRIWDRLFIAKNVIKKAEK
jgi:hypothetical protein